MPAFDELPDDILLEICEFVGGIGQFRILPWYREYLYNLRLVSRRLSTLVGHLLFRELVVKSSRQTSAINSGSITVFDYTKELIFYANSNGPPTPFTLEPISNLTELAVLWSCEAPHIIFEIASLLTRCPNLITLQLADKSSNEITLNDVFLEAGKMEESLQLNDLLLHDLIVTVEKARASMDIGAICSIFQQNHIYLEHLSTDYLDDLLLTYLSSYAGLKSLELTTQPGGRDGFEVVNRLYTQVIPTQAEVLADFRLYLSDSEEWCTPPTKSQLAGLAKCRNLKCFISPSIFTLENEGSARSIWARVLV
ncbi:hypothetical protein AGABI2DRAFT_115647 [Agaricus bisporus var. bisporus H97]|uniref:hypothetical protein n=1 Tax=Agaricus bisporus var. bisporus (strain H97 / ATCC MYA-4626 / FGSC 10389) TaxID=936046 RepID=UPI00029F6B50|nr:hypothetical protein AGABI2DRAFT_115647 [Agaricus bisporus var. bisporus H97]EKV50574.1 hypothetical protein AGABI2DRAFT_115647 [Agaricus bisporus var. bisporus H97]